MSSVTWVSNLTRFRKTISLFMHTVDHLSLAVTSLAELTVFNFLAPIQYRQKTSCNVCSAMSSSWHNDYFLSVVQMIDIVLAWHYKSYISVVYRLLQSKDEHFGRYAKPVFATFCLS